MALAGIVMLLFAPDLLRSRLNMREEQGDQQLVIKLSGLMFVAAFVVVAVANNIGYMAGPMNMWNVGVAQQISELPCSPVSACRCSGLCSARRDLLPRRRC